MDQTITNHIRQHLLDLCGIKKEHPQIIKEQCEWSKKFMELMINRIVMGHYRYGDKNAPCRKFNRSLGEGNYIDEIAKRLNNYVRTGNLEYLVDAANFCMLEFNDSTHSEKHFKPIDDGEHYDRTK